MSGIERIHRIVPRRRADQIVELLERFIIDEGMHDGDQLPPMTALSAQLGVSPNVLREGLSLLEQRGLVAVRPGLGVFVTRPSVANVRESLDTLIRHEGASVVSVFRVRVALEVEIAGLAAERRDDDDTRRVSEALEDMAEAFGEDDRYYLADLRFHAILAEISRDPLLKMLHDSMQDLLNKSLPIIHRENRARGFTLWRPDRSLPDHRAICTAVIDGDGDEARTAMRHHLIKALGVVEAITTPGVDLPADPTEQRRDRTMQYGLG